MRKRSGTYEQCRLSSPVYSLFLGNQKKGIFEKTWASLGKGKNRTLKWWEALLETDPSTNSHAGRIHLQNLTDPRNGVAYFMSGICQAFNSLSYQACLFDFIFLGWGLEWFLLY